MARFQVGGPANTGGGEARLVCRFGEALHTLTGRRHDCPGGLGYAQLYEICLEETSYRIRLAAAQQIGRGGAVAFQEIKQKLDVPGKPTKGRRAVTRPARGGAAESAWPRREHGAGRRRSARAEQVSAWLAPLLVASIGAAGDDREPGSAYQEAEQNLKMWRQYVRSPGRSGARRAISQEIALAQGFKYAANRRYGQVYARCARASTGGGPRDAQARPLLVLSAHTDPGPLPWEIQAREWTARGQYWNPDAIATSTRLKVISGEQPRDGRGGSPIHPFVAVGPCLPPGPWRPVIPSASCGWTRVTWSPESVPATK